MEKLTENLEFSEEDFRRLEGSKLLDKKKDFSDTLQRMLHDYSDLKQVEVTEYLILK